MENILCNCWLISSDIYNESTIFRIICLFLIIKIYSSSKQVRLLTFNIANLYSNLPLLSFEIQQKFVCMPIYIWMNWMWSVDFIWWFYGVTWDVKLVNVRIVTGFRMRYHPYVLVPDRKVPDLILELEVFDRKARFIPADFYIACAKVVHKILMQQIISLTAIALNDTIRIGHSIKITKTLSQSNLCSRTRLFERKKINRNRTFALLSAAALIFYRVVRVLCVPARYSRNYLYIWQIICIFG